MAAGAPDPLCGGGVGRELPSPERPTLRTRVPHHHLVPRPPGVPGPDWGRGRPAPLGEGRSRGSGLERLGGWGHKCRGGGYFGDCGAGQRCPDARPPALVGAPTRPSGRTALLPGEAWLGLRARRAVFVGEMSDEVPSLPYSAHQWGLWRLELGGL